MFNQNGITKVSGLATRQILANTELQFSVGVIVSNTGIVANADGRKIIPAGTPIGGATSALATRNTVLGVTNTAETASTAQGVLLHDIDVTKGNTNATMLVFGFVDVTKIETAAKPITEVKTALNKITFIGA
jgi:uncharacterized protein (DUF697 family)